MDDFAGWTHRVPKMWPRTNPFHKDEKYEVELVRVAFLRKVAEKYPDLECPMWMLFDEEPFQEIINVIRSMPVTPQRDGDE